MQTNTNETPSHMRFGARLTVIARRWRNAVDARLHLLDLSDATWPPLYHLHVSGEAISQRALAERIGLDDSTLVRLLNILEVKGFVVRQIDKKDKRARTVSLTSTGRKVVDQLRAELEAVESELLDGIPPQKIAAALDAFDAIDAKLLDPVPHAAARVSSSVFNVTTGRNAPVAGDNTVTEGDVSKRKE